MQPTIKIALVGAGMFGGDVHLRAYADLQRFGIAGQLARVGLDKYSRDLAEVKFDLVAVATRTQKSAQRSAEQFKQLIAEGRGTLRPVGSKQKRGTRVTRPSEENVRGPRGYFGETTWHDIPRD